MANTDVNCKRFSSYRAVNTFAVSYKQDRQCTYKRNIQALSRNDCCH
jgi:hypothetical protein